jgi:osmoprotectant transport system substrate-binding protein
MKTIARTPVALAVVGLAAALSLSACNSSKSNAASGNTGSGNGSDITCPSNTPTTSAASTAATVRTPTAGKGNASGGSVTIGSTNFPENVLLGEIYAQALEAKGVQVTRKFNIQSREVTYPLVKKGSLTIVPEYNGALLTYLQPNNTASTTQAVDAALDSALPSSLEILQPSPAEDKDALAVTQQTAQQYGLHSITDLVSSGKNLNAGGPAEFATRQEGLVGLKCEYGVTFKSYTKLDESGPLTVAGLKHNNVQAAVLFSTDPNIAANNFVVLDDPKNLFGTQNVVPLVNTADMTNTMITTLDAVSAKLDTATLAHLVSEFSLQGQDVKTVAKNWLSSAGIG